MTQDILVAIGMINELLQIPSALNLLSKDVKKMTFFIDNLLAIIKKYLWFTELDTDNEGNLYEGESIHKKIICRNRLKNEFQITKKL